MIDISYFKQANFKDWFIRAFCLDGSFQWAVKEMQAGRAIKRSHPMWPQEYRLSPGHDACIIEMKSTAGFQYGTQFYINDFSATDWTSRVMDHPEGFFFEDDKHE